ncbi:hypothetical protein [Brevundimonas bullata]
MTSKIHFICKAKAGLTGVYESEAWLLSEDDVVALKGGEVLFHETKGRPSYFGGVIQDIRPAESTDLKDQDRKRRVITPQSTAACRGVDWDASGQIHDMAWTSGVITASPARSDEDA